ncbi:MAG: BolA family protein [Alphaproteobacteria bacterium]|nr:BolA family protein [Alphaproteobacteria bacterium]
MTTRFAPIALEVSDESDKHHGHAGARPEGETHFRVRITAPEFAGLTRVARHRAITDALAAEFASGLHALSIDAQVP